MLTTKSDLHNVTSDSTYLSEEERVISNNDLSRYKLIYDGKLGTWNTNTVYIYLQPDAKPYHNKPYPFPRSHEGIFKEKWEVFSD